MSIIGFFFRSVIRAHVQAGALAATIYASAIAAVLLSPAIFASIRLLFGLHPLQIGVKEVDRVILAISLLSALIMVLLIFVLPERKSIVDACSSRARTDGLGSSIGVLILFMALFCSLVILGEKQPMLCVSFTGFCLLPLLRR